MKHYAKSVKDDAVAKLMPPQSMSISEVSKLTGISEQSLYNWRKQSRNKGLVVPGNQKKSEKWSSSEKFAVVIEVANMNEAQISEYCRKKGIFPEQVEQWRTACMQANEAQPKQLSKSEKQQAVKELQKVKRLERELRRKDKALAETAALLVLQKKAQEIWGVDEDD